MFMYIFCQWLTEDFLKLTNIGRHHLFLLCHKLHDASSVLGDLCFHLKMLIIQKPIMRVWGSKPSICYFRREFCRAVLNQKVSGFSS